MAKIEITLTLPDVFNVKKLVAATTKAVNQTLDEIERDFISSAKDFTHKPTFIKHKAKLEGNVVRGSVGTNDENYARLNNGTSGHYVPKTGRRKMTFRRGYNQKTRRGRIPSVQGGPHGEWMTSYRHWIRGIDPRKFDETIARKNDSTLSENVAKAIDSLK